MINVSEELKNAVINEEMPKTLTISSQKSIEKLNWYSEEFTPNIGYGVNLTSDRVINVTNDMRTDLLDFSYQDISVRKAYSLYVKASVANRFWLRVDYVKTGGTSDYTAKWFDVSANEDTRLYITTSVGISEITSIQLLVETLPYSATVIVSKPQLDMKLENTTEPLPYNNSLFATSENVSIYAEGTDFVSLSNSNIFEQNFSFTESICSADKLKLGGCEQAEIDFSAFDIPNITNTRIDAKLNINNKGNFEWKNFTVAKCDKKVRGNYTIRDCVAYDDLYKLDENAYSWYTSYAWGMNVDWHSETPLPYVFDFERKIFSTFYNLMKNFGIESACEHSEEWVTSKTYLQTSNAISFDYKTVSASSYGRVYYVDFDVTPSADYQAYKVRLNGMNTVPTDYEDYDPLYRGVLRACVCVEFETDGHEIEWGGLYDLDEPFVIPSNCTSFTVHVPMVFVNSNGQTGDYIATQAVLYGVNFTHYDPNDIINASESLPYYTTTYPKPTVNDICKLWTSLTAREVARSLMEMCGCFFRLGRDGNPQFIYAQEHGLYPSNDLYPADDLFPKKSGEMTMPTTYYITAEFAEYQVEKFGGVQVVAESRNNTGVAVKYEYWWDNDSDNAYIIDDNVFLCAEELLNSVGTSYPKILKNLETALDNLQYTPFTADTIGTPFLESGDRFTLLTRTDGFESFIFERKLKGIQALRDYYEARGVAKTPRVTNYWES